MRNPGRRLVPLAIALTLAAGCTSTPPEGDGAAPAEPTGESTTSTATSAPDPTTTTTEPLPPSGVLRATTDDHGRAVDLAWAEIDDAVRYLLGAGSTWIDLSLNLCTNGVCRVSVDSQLLADAEAITIRPRFPPNDLGDEPLVATIPAGSREEPVEPYGTDGVAIVVSEVDEATGRPSYTVEAGLDLDAALARIEALGSQGVSASLNLPGFAVGGFTATGTGGGTEDDAGGSETPPVPSAAVAATQMANWQSLALDYHDLPSTGEGITIAVIDTGVDPSHREFVGASILPGVGFTQHDTAPSGGGTTTPGAHGTAVTSMIVGQRAVPGSAVDARILPIDIHDPDSEANVARLNAAIVWAVDNGADIINVSYAFTCIDLVIGFAGCPQGVGEAVAYAEAAGVLIVAAAGNNGDGAERCTGGNRFLNARSNADVWPAVEPNVISVGGSVRDGDTWECSPDRDDVDALAPAGPFLVAKGTDAYTLTEGTSYSAPIVTGVLASFLAADPDLDPLELRDQLIATRQANDVISIPDLLTALGLDDPPPEVASTEFDFALGGGSLDGYQIFVDGHAVVTTPERTCLAVFFRYFSREHGPGDTFSPPMNQLVFDGRTVGESILACSGVATAAGITPPPIPHMGPGTQAQMTAVFEIPSPDISIEAYITGGIRIPAR